MYMIVGIILSSVLCVTTGFASTYTWEDDQGTINFTEDPGTIPSKYRKKAKIAGEDELPVQDKTETSEPKSYPRPAGIPEVTKETPPEKQGKKVTVYGNKDEDSWKKEFSRIRDEQKLVGDQLASKKAMMNDTGKLTRIQYKSLEYEIKSLEYRMNELADKLKTLQEEASRAGVPVELQQ